MASDEPKNGVVEAADRPISSIDEYLSDPWPEESHKSLTGVRQGFVLPCPTLLYPTGEGPRFWNPSADILVEHGPRIVEIDARFNPKYCVLTSQTCDIADYSKKRPWVQVTPLFLLEDKSQKKPIERGWHGSYWHIPGVPEDGYWVADFRLVVTVEKSWLAEVASDAVDGCQDDPAERRNLANALARIVTRPAIPDEVLEFVAHPLVNSLRNLAKDEPEKYSLLAEYVDHFCLNMDPDDVAPTAVSLVVITEESENSQDENWEHLEAHEWLEAFAVEVRNSEPSFDFVGIDFEWREEITLADHADMVRIEVSRLSPHEGLEQKS